TADPRCTAARRRSARRGPHAVPDLQPDPRRVGLRRAAGRRLGPESHSYIYAAGAPALVITKRAAFLPPALLHNESSGQSNVRFTVSAQVRGKPGWKLDV